MDFKKYTQNSFFMIAGPCVVESETLCMNVAQQLKKIGEELHIPFIFKASYKKANRTSVQSFSGIGDEKALKILEKVKTVFDIPILTDVHETKDVDLVKDIIDIIQIPAFLCRQTELIQKAAATMKPVNIKKGQFVSAQTMILATEKVSSMGNTQYMLTERGTFLGYEDLVVDMRNIPRMKQSGAIVIYDSTHSIQQPGKMGTSSGGVRDMIEPLTWAAIAAGADGVFVETHPDPRAGLSDAGSMLPLKDFKAFISKAKSVFELAKTLQ